MKIDKGIPIPGRNARIHGISADVWGSFEVGDSMLVGKPGDKAVLHSGKQQRAQNVTGWTFETRAVPEGVRIWRVA